MRKLKLAAGVLAIAFAWALWTQPAHASSGIQLSSTYLTANGFVTFNGAGSCRLSLTVMLDDDTIEKSFGVSQATITRASTTACGGLIAGAALLTPIRLQYSGFGGTLPDISDLVFDAPDFAFSVDTPAGTCLYGGWLWNLRIDTVGGYLDSLSFYATGSLPKLSGGFLCPSWGTLAGDIFISAARATLV